MHILLLFCSLIEHHTFLKKMKVNSQYIDVSISETFSYNMFLGAWKYGNV